MAYLYRVELPTCRNQGAEPPRMEKLHMFLEKKVEEAVSLYAVEVSCACVCVRKRKKGLALFWLLALLSPLSSLLPLVWKKTR